MVKILLAGDDVVSLGEISSVAEASGYRVVCVTTGLEAQEDALAELPDLIILEAGLAIFSGFEVCQTLREHPDIPIELPILILSSEDISAKQLEQCGATAHISKGASSYEFHEVFVRYLADAAAG